MSENNQPNNNQNSNQNNNQPPSIGQNNGMPGMPGGTGMPGLPGGAGMPGMPSGAGMPGMPSGAGMPGGQKSGSINPIKQKEVDIMDPEAKAKSTEKKSVSDMANDVKEKVDDVKKTIENITNVIKTLGPYGCLAVLIIIIIIGLIGFLMNIPGLTIGKLKEFAQGAADFIQGLVMPEALAEINGDDIVNAANYLEEMEYDLVGYGFVEPTDDFSSNIITLEELQEKGYYIYEDREDDGKFRYYNEAGEKYNGTYYNSVGIPIDNETGEMDTDDNEYWDEFGIKRSTEEIASSGKGKIVELMMDKCNLIKTYLLSDYRILTLRNDDQGMLNKIYASIMKTFGGFEGAWATGLMKIYHADKGEATKAWGFWDEFLWTNDISIDKEGKTLRIRKGWFNNSTSFKIEGWAARYGLSLEFLLSLHIGTMAPDLVNAIIQNFDTEVQVYLQESGDSEVASVYVEPDAGTEYKTPEKGLNLQDIKDVIAAMPTLFSNMQAGALNSGSATEFVNSLFITRKNALAILKETQLESPSNCTGSAQAYKIEKSTYETESMLFGLIDTSSDALKYYGMGREPENTDTEVYDTVNLYENYEFKSDSGEDLTFSAEHCTQAIGTDKESYKNEDYTHFPNTAIGFGYNSSNAEIDEIVKDEFETTSHATTNDNGTEYDKGDDVTTGNCYKLYKVKQRRTWYAIAGEDQEEVEFEWVTFKYLVYQSGTFTQKGYIGEKEKSYFTEEVWVDTIMFEYIIREKTTQELKDAGILDEEGNYVGEDQVVCSKNGDLEVGRHKCCKNCLKYVEKVIAALANVEDKNYDTYTPYIARVVGSWFRDTYFVIPKTPDIAIREYVEGKEGEVEIEGSGDANGDGVETEEELKNRDKRKVYLPGHHDSSLYDAYYTESGENNLELVLVDQEYLADSGEYWTDYEIKLNGDYQLYYLSPDGSFKAVGTDEEGNTLYMTMEMFLEQHPEYPSKAAAEEDGIAFVKKAKTISATSLETEKQEDEEEYDNILWMAYGFDTNGNESGWTRITREDGNRHVNAVYDIKEPDENSGFYYNILSTNTVTQVEDAYRSQTNRTIKTLFKYRKYYIYDGTTERAWAIEADKEIALDYAKSKLKEKYGSSWTSKAAQQLGKYGRSALRQAYGNTYTVNTEGLVNLIYWWIDDELVEEINDYIAEYMTNENDIATQWLEWQLDMFYSVKDGEGENSYRNNGYLIIDKDPRNPDLISTVNIDKSSLNAFTILENTRTLDAEYQYRDFKELIVELDYFDKEDLSEELESVFTWVLPEVESAGWPVRPWDKQNNEYGALIESKATYDYLRGEESEEDVEDEEEDPTDTDPENPEDVPEEPDTPTDGEDAEETEEEEKIDENKIFFIGDDWIAGLRDSGVAKSNYFKGQAEVNAGELNSSDINIPADASAIVIHFGINGPDKFEDTKSLINQLILDNPGIPVFVLKTSHVGEGYIAGDVGASAFNTSIDEYNKKMQEYCTSTDNVTFIDPTKNICEDNGSGYLKADYKADEKTLNSEGYKKWYADIIEQIEKNAEGESGAGSGRTLAVFEGYEADNYVVSPVTGRVIEYGTHKRVNVYNDEDAPEEEVGYIVIEVLDKGENDDEGYFTQEMVENNSQDTEDITLEDATNGLNAFYKEYDGVCAGYTIMIDGFDVDLSLQDEDGKNGSYEENEITTLYNKSEEDQRKALEEAKANAPFFVKYGVDGELGNSDSFPAEYKASEDENDIKGYYIKEGKYIGKTIENEPIDVPDDGEGEENTETEDKLVNNEHTGPKDYIRIIVKDTDYTVIDDVEEFFDIEDYLYQGGSGQAFNAFNAEVTEEEMEMLAAVLVGEHGSSAEAMTAVCQVIKNRGNDTIHFSKVSTIGEVLTATGQYGTVFPVGDNNNPKHQGGLSRTPPSGSYTKIYDLGELGKFVVGNQWGANNPFNERFATDESRSIVEGVLSGSIADEASAQMGKLALYQVTNGSKPNHDSCCIVIGELFAHNWGCLTGKHESCDCTLP